MNVKKLKKGTRDKNRSKDNHQPDRMNEIMNSVQQNNVLPISNQEITISYLTSIEKKIELNERVNSMLSTKKRELSSPVFQLRKTVTVLTLLASFLILFASKAFLGLKIIPEDGNIQLWLFVLGFGFSVALLLFAFRLNRIRDRIDEFKDILDDKEKLYGLVCPIFDQSEKEKSKEEIEDWIQSRYEFKIDPPRVFSDEGLESMITKIVKVIKVNEFSKILLLKATSSKIIEEVQLLKNNNLTIKYKLTPINNV